MCIVRALYFSTLNQDAGSILATFGIRPIVFLLLLFLAALGQAQSLSITNYQLVSQQTIQRTVNVTYRAIS